MAKTEQQKQENDDGDDGAEKEYSTFKTTMVVSGDHHPKKGSLAVKQRLKNLFFLSLFLPFYAHAQTPQQALQQALALEKECVWEAAIENFEVAYPHYADNISLDERLGIALPADVKPFYSNLSPTGRFDLNFENVSVFTSDDGEKYIDIEGSFRFKSCNFNTTPVVTGLNATFETKGLYKTGVGLSYGQVAVLVDSVGINRRLVNELRADLHYDSVEHNWVADNLKANCHNGKLAGELELKQFE